MTELTHGDYDITSVEGFDTLMAELVTINEYDEYSDAVNHVADLLLNGHEGVAGYLTFGNNKIHKSVGIFNMNSATDCPNAKTKESGESETGLCQVPWDSCYAHVAENVYPDTLKKRRLQEYLWDNIDSETFGKALIRVEERKRSPFTTIRFSESGDFRHTSDIIKVDRIAEIVSDSGIDVYTYSASHKLNWSLTEHFTVMASNDVVPYGDKRYVAVPEESDVPDDGLLCPYDRTDGDIKCGECRACIEPHGPDVYITLH